MSAREGEAFSAARALRPLPEARPLALFAAAFQLCFVAAITLFKASANALLIARVSSTWLPVLYILAALATGVLALALARLPRRAAARAPAASLVAGAALALLFWSALPRLGTVGLSALYLCAEAFATLVSLRYWEALGHAFDARQARRLFTLLGAAGMGGAIVGGALCPLLARRASAEALLPAGALFALLTGLSGAAFRRGVAGAARPHAASGEPLRGGAGGVRAPAAPGARPGSRALSYLWRDPHTRGLAFVALLLAALTAVVDYLFRRRAGSVLGERGLASLFGELNLVVGLVTVVFQLGVAQRLLARFGIFRYLLVPPVGVAASAGLSLFVPGLAPIFLAKAIETAGSLSVTQSGFQLLYGPVPPELSAPVRGLVDGLAKKTGFALGGILLLLLGTRSSDPVLACAAVGLALLVAFALIRQRPLYVRALGQRLTAARPLTGGELDADARALLVQELSLANPQRVLNALELLSADRGFFPRPRLGALLAHPEERVREVAARLCATAGAREQLPALVAIAERDPARRPRDEAVRALAALASPEEAEVRLEAFARSVDPGLRAAAVEALHLSGPRGVFLAAEGLRRSLAGTTPAERREAARLIGKLSLASAVPRLRELLADPDASVRAVACGAAAKLRDPALVEPLLGLLVARATRRSAREALAAYGDLLVERAALLLDDRRQLMALRLELPRLLRYLGTERAGAALPFSNTQDDAFLRYRIGLSLSRWREANPTVPVDAGRVREAVFRRLDAYEHYLPVYADVRAALGDRALLARALEGRLDQSLEVAFRLLGLLHPTRALLSAHRRFTGPDPRERAQAVELLDSLLDGELRLRLVTLLEAHHRHPTLPTPGDASRLAVRLDDLASSRDALLGALARAARRDRAPPGADDEVSVSALGLEKILLLEGVDIFAGCAVDDLAALAAVASERRFGPGEAIYRDGDPGETLYVIVEGSVRILKGGRELLLLGPREAFGSVSLMDGAPRPADAIALGPVRCLALGRGDFLDLIADRPELLKGVFSAVTDQLRRMLDLAGGTGKGAPTG